MIEPSPRLRDRCAVVGTGTSRLGKVPGVSAHGLLEEAMKNALDDAGLATHDVDGLICRGPDEIYSFHQVMGERLGIDANFSTTLTNGGASQRPRSGGLVRMSTVSISGRVACAYRLSSLMWR